MLKDAASRKAEARSTAGLEEPFVRALRKVRQRYEGKAISTSELMDVFAEELPPSLRYEGKKSLDWFLDGWVNGTSLPRLELKGVKITPKGSGVGDRNDPAKEAPEDLVTSVPVYAMMRESRQCCWGESSPTGRNRVSAVGARGNAKDRARSLRDGAKYSQISRELNDGLTVRSEFCARITLACGAAHIAGFRPEFPTTERPESGLQVQRRHEACRRPCTWPHLAQS